MSYSITDAIAERNHCIIVAIENDDYLALYNYAELFSKEGEDEAAEHLLALATKAYRNEWGYDQERDNNFDYA